MKDITTPEDGESAKSDYVESLFEDKNITNPQNNKSKEDWISITIIMKTVGELKDKDDPQLYLKYHYVLSIDDINLQDDSNSFKEAVKSDDADKWIDAMNDELNSINKNDV
jgi:hypothetical protein